MELLWSSVHHTFWWIPFPNSLRVLQVGQGHVRLWQKMQRWQEKSKRLLGALEWEHPSDLHLQLRNERNLPSCTLTSISLSKAHEEPISVVLTSDSESKRSQKCTSITLTQDTAWNTYTLSLPLSLPPRNSAKWKAKPSLQENQTKAMCPEPSLWSDRHREFARANKFQSQRISAESSLQPVLLRPAPHFPASSCCSNRGKEASHYNDTFDSFAKSTWGGAKERSSALSWKKQTLWGGILEILLLVNLNGWAPTQRSTWPAVPKESREHAPPGFSLSRACPPSLLSGIQSICIEEWPSLPMLGLTLKTSLAAESQPDTLHLPCPSPCRASGPCCSTLGFH